MRQTATFGALLLALCTGSGALAADFTAQTVTVGMRKSMEATLYVPKGPGPFPTILEMHTSGGISEADRGYCANLAREGYICIAPAFLRAHGINSPELRRKAFTSEARPIMEDFRGIMNELQAMPQARKGATGVVGFSNGGYFAALIASLGRVKAAVSYYGTFTGANTDKNLDRMRERWKASSSPLLILAGENDTTIGAETPRALEAIIKAVGAPYEIKMYSGVGHDFDRSGSTGPNNGAAAADAWQRTLVFLRAHGV
ncbi:MAG: dienelactone hydrolase family protein [Proteobacteria bacterium]|nr:dienelactone hydrolase family protein [Pseudomonadota bacterium]